MSHRGNKAPPPLHRTLAIISARKEEEEEEEGRLSRACANLTTKANEARPKQGPPPPPGNNFRTLEPNPLSVFRIRENLHESAGSEVDMSSKTPLPCPVCGPPPEKIFPLSQSRAHILVVDHALYVCVP